MNIFFVITISLFISFKKTVQSSNFDIKIIPDANLNATAAFASLEDSNDEFLYFSYDFNYHNQVSERDKDVSFFKITTGLNFSLKDINYLLVDKRQEEINSTYFDSNNKIFWKPCYLISTEKIFNEYNYYIQINKLGENKNTLILRIPILKKVGDITIENVYSNTLPEEILDKANKYKNINNWPIKKDKNEMNIYKDDKIHAPHNIENHHYYHKELCIIFVFFGIILGLIWMKVLIFYCIFNKRIKNNIVLTTENQQN